ncbi:uncharacterized protein LOC131024408 isoform X2 [Salvia miltiorrhiza]|uniref:uncharacterized protein LOC131024408 isoform X2 n=1 Tax=Salvia miltiorrhiza TaxID=226208 RepID=UPI0025ACCD1A|nr:uncharacterized protein LOC131024408 isoform X2 [Salvia miltiorrhiza]
MFATQLLRILQTTTSDVKCETCVCDSAAQDMIMKENQNGTRYDSNYLGRDSDPLAVGSKEKCLLNGLKRDTHPSLFEQKGAQMYWNPKVDDDLLTDNQNRNGHLKADEFQNRPLCRLESLEDDIDSVSSDTNAKDEVQTKPEHNCAAAGEEFMYGNENESSDCSSPYVSAASDLFSSNENMFTDKNVLEYQRPELIVCYKEINYHVVKDICVDERMPTNRRILMDNSDGDQSENYFPHPLSDHNHHKATGGVDAELLISNGLAATSLDSADFTVANQQGSKKESNGILLVQGRPNLPSERSSFEDTATGCNLEESMQIDEMNFGATREIARHASDEESFVDRTLPIQEFGTRSFLRSFLNAFDAEGNEVKQLPDQISSAKARPKEDVQTSSLNYNSKVETRSITFNFNSLAPVVGGAKNGKTELIKEQSVDSKEVTHQKNEESDIFTDPRQSQWSSKDTNTREISGKSLNNDAFPNDFSARDQPQNSSSNDNALALDQSLDCKDDKYADNTPVASLRRYDLGESSFSADSFITHSGPIAFSGNVSLRSDGSATSGRSFAFPVLQSEWNCSPVRMTDADRRRFRRHKGWRSGLLCCRF